MKITTSNGSGIKVGDIIISSDDNYFNNIITYATKTTLTTRKMEWFEDTDTIFLVIFVYWGLVSILFKLVGSL